jgi:glycosyltransferase involved in cell wall biosynthesis
MRLTFLCTSDLDYPSPRGRWLPLAHELAALGHEVRLVMTHHAFDRLPKPRRRQADGGVVVYYAGQMHVYGPVGQRRYYGAAALLRVSLLGAIRLAAAAVRFGGDALHVCKPQPINGLAGLLAARALGVPLYVDCDDYEAGNNRFGGGWQRRLVQLWEDNLPRRAAGVTVNTRFLQRRCRALGVPAGRIAYVPNGIAASRIAIPDSRAAAGLRAGMALGDAPVVAYVGTLSQTTHNVGLLLDAFALVVARVPGVRLLLVGDGEDRRALEDRAWQLGLGPRALFAGSVPHASIPAYLALAACSVDPVADDPVARARSPLKIVESLAAGTPVVTGDVGDRAEVLGRDGGVLVAPGSAQALADGIVAALEDATPRAQHIAQAQARAADYRWDRLAKHWLNVYRSAG